MVKISAIGKFCLKMSINSQLSNNSHPGPTVRELTKTTVRPAECLPCYLQAEKTTSAVREARSCVKMELRRPERPASGALYSYRKGKETHSLISSWLSWIERYCSWACTHDDDNGDDGVGKHGGHTPNNRLTEPCSLGLPCTSLILDDRLTPVKTRYPQTSIMRPHHALKFTAHRGLMFFFF